MPRRTIISEIMTKDVVTLDVLAPISEARRILSKGPFHHLPVVDGEQLVGIVSSNDLLRLMKRYPTATKADLSDTLDAVTTLEKTMQTDLVTMRDYETVDRAIDLLASGELHSLLIVNRDDNLVGIVTNIDVLDYLFD